MYNIYNEDTVKSTETAYEAERSIIVTDEDEYNFEDEQIAAWCRDVGGTAEKTPIKPAIREVPFITPVITLAKEDISVDIVSQENGYFITDKKGTEDPYTDKAIPTVFIDNKVLNESYYLMNKKAQTRDEICLFYLIKKVSAKYPHFLAYGYFITEQEVTGVEVEADGPDTRRYYTYLQENYGEEFQTNLHRKILPVHSHHTMGNGWSGTDLKQQNSRGDMGFCDDYRMFGVWTIKDKMRMSYIQYFPIYHRIENINIGMKISTTEFSLPKERKMELDDILIKLVKDKAHTAPGPVTQNKVVYNQNWNQAVFGAKAGAGAGVLVPDNKKILPSTSNIVEKYKLLSLLDIIKKTVEVYFKSADISRPILNVDTNEILIQQIQSDLMENILNTTLIPREEWEFHKNTEMLISYIICEYKDTLPLSKDNDMDKVIYKDYTDIFGEVCDNISTWVNDDDENVPLLKNKINLNNPVNSMNIIDEIIFDGMMEVSNK